MDLIEKNIILFEGGIHGRFGTAGFQLADRGGGVQLLLAKQVLICRNVSSLCCLIPNSVDFGGKRSGKNEKHCEST